MTVQDVILHSEVPPAMSDVVCCRLFPIDGRDGARGVRDMPRRNAFTLIELLVVVSVIGLLVAILLPSLRSARVQAKRALCSTNLRQIGVGMRGYLGDHKDRFPIASAMPSVSEDPIYIADILEPYVGTDPNVYACPGDRPGKFQRPPPITNMSYFETERSSYEYRFRLGGRTIMEYVNRIQQHGFSNGPLPVNTLYIMRDYNNFHAKSHRVAAEVKLGEEEASEARQRNYLFVDGHVADYEKF